MVRPACLSVPAALLLGFLLVAGCTRAPSPESLSAEGHNVIVIVVDTCRADHIGVMGSSWVRTPAFDRIARDGVLFTRAYTPVPMTLPAHASLFTGLHPVHHGVRDNFNAVLPEEAITLAERFADRGYSTGAVIAAIVLGKQTHIQQGFATYDDTFSEEAYRSGQPILERVANEVTAAATGWFENRSSDQPFFYFAHYYDPHLLYRPPAPFAAAHPGHPYRGEVAYADHEIGQLFDYLDGQGLYDESLIIITADHGEGLGDHKELSHGLFLYEETTHVPLAIKLPASVDAPRGEKTRQIVSLMDLAPTLEDLCGLNPTPTDGQSLRRWLADPDLWEFRSLVLETQYPLTFEWSPLFALVDHEWKYIHAPRPELYNLASDPGETDNRLAPFPDQAAEMRQALEQRLLDLAEPALDPQSMQPSADRTAQLASLGYVGGGGTSDDLSANQQLPDPKDTIDIYLKIDRGLLALSKGDIPTGIRLFTEVIRDDPANPTGHLNLGLAYARLNNWETALHHTERALEISPDHTMMRLQLGRILVRDRQFERARSVFEHLLQSHPNLADAHFQLGYIAEETGEQSRALSHYRQAQTLMPHRPGVAEAIARVDALPE